MKNKILAFLLAVMLAAFAVIPVSADAYEGYVYDPWGNETAAPAGYEADAVIRGEDLGVGNFSAPEDFFIADSKIYLVDSKNNRIVVINEDLCSATVIDRFTLPDGTETTLLDPSGVYVREQKLYVADSGNSRVLIADFEGTVSAVLARPDSDLTPEETGFKPTKVTADSAGNTYVLCEGFYQGLICYDVNGEFSGFFGGNEVELTFSMVAQLVWKRLFSEERSQNMQRYVPVEYSNLYIDEDDFIYVCTRSSQNSINEIQCLNYLGNNVLPTSSRDNESFGSNMIQKNNFGDIETANYRGKTYDSTIVDVHADEEGIMTILDQERGKVFQYDQDLNLLFVFGVTGDQKGTFDLPVAIEKLGERYLVLDRDKNSITVFKPTHYALLLRKGMTLYNDGQYAMAEDTFREVLVENSGCLLAYRNLGKSLLEEGKWSEAMYYFEIGQDRDSYSRALREYRKEFVRQYFVVILLGIIAVILLLYFGVRWVKKRLGVQTVKQKIRFT